MEKAALSLSDDELLTPSEAAALLHISESTLRNLARKYPNAIPRITLSPRVIRFRLSSVRTFIAVGAAGDAA